MFRITKLVSLARHAHDDHHFVQTGLFSKGEYMTISGVLDPISKKNLLRSHTTFPPDPPRHADASRRLAGPKDRLKPWTKPKTIRSVIN
jgi:hypothetical protein